MAPKVDKKVVPAVEGPMAAAVLDKYKCAAGVVQTTLVALIAKAVAGANILELCAEGDALLEAGTAGFYNKKVDSKILPKGIAFPTCFSVNSILQNFSPLPSDPTASAVLAVDDVVKISLGAHIDGYAVISAETIVVSPSTLPIVDVRANLLAAVHHAAEVAIRLVKPGGKNWEVTEGIKRVLAEYDSVGIKGVETLMSHQHEQGTIEAKKGIVAFPSIQQRSDGDNAFTLDEGEVYGLNIVVSNSEKAVPKVDESRTTVFQKLDAKYELKMKTSRATFSEIVKKAGDFPFTLRCLENESKARMGVRECKAHGLLKSYDLTTTDRPTDLSAQLFLTFAVTATGAIRLSAAPTFFTPTTVTSSVELKNEETKAILARPLKAKAIKKKKEAGAEVVEA